MFTAPYVAKMGGKVFAMDPDPKAAAQAYWNVQANPKLAQMTTVLPLCISDKPGTLTMRGSQGSSMSSIVDSDAIKAEVGKAKDTMQWTVDCVRLDAFVEANGLNPKNLVMKIDTEGAERQILVSHKDWFIKNKPPMLLSMHAFAYPDNTDGGDEALMEVIFSYPTVLLSDGSEFDRRAFSLRVWCRLCALILADFPISKADLETL
jgi:FkbM family methyltransferase